MKIITTPNPILRKKAQPLLKITPEIKKIIKQMIKTMRENKGVGLSAPQIGKSFQIVIIEAEKTEKIPFIPLKILINPKITKHSNEIEIDEEGCLSLPNIWGKVPRFKKVEVSYLDENGRKSILKSEGFLARVLQHEIDHLQGILFVDRVENISSLYQITKNGEKVQVIKI